MSSRVGFLLALVPFGLAVVQSARTEPGPPLVPSKERPTLVFEEYLRHYGAEPIQPVSLLKTEFRFRNTGTETVRIRSLEPSCGCLTPQMSAREIAPGEAGVILLPVQTANEPAGPREYLVNVHYEDTRPRIATLTVKVNLPEPGLIVEPRALWTSHTGDRDLDTMILVTSAREERLEVYDVRSNSPRIRVEASGVVRTDRGWQATVDVNIPGPFPAGVHRTILSARTNDPDRPLVEIPVVIRGPDRPVAVRASQTGMRLSVPSVGGPAVTSSLILEAPADWNWSSVRAYPDVLQAEFEDVAVETVAGTAMRVLDQRSGGAVQQASGAAEASVMMKKTRVRITLPAGEYDFGRDGSLTLYADDGVHSVSFPLMLVHPQ